ncbi:MAG TPA: Stp1/IreP family PP2C-type Ser/Thr phosphatase [Solirubrobacteraceae bacterium]|nr:Stp1/IreP family PP2C-type Ser/Thr phosphatase [Solirubrobacteraceae bacterium]
MLRVAEQYSGTDTGLQRRANEDSLLVRSPLFVVADGMGGAQAGEVASRMAVESFQQGLDDPDDPERSLAEHTRRANLRIHQLSQSNDDQAGMGTTLTAVYVGVEEVAIAHVGDSRAYCFRDGELLRLTDDHSLVDELIRQGKLTPEEAEEHPQRSIITRALGPESSVEVDTRSFRARADDLFLLCSDGLTTMVPEARLGEVLRAHTSTNTHPGKQPLREVGEALIAAANEAGGRDNITVILLRLEEVQMPGAPVEHEHPTMTDMPAIEPQPRAAEQPRPVGAPRAPRQASAGPLPRRSGRKRARRAGAALAVLLVLAVLGAGAYVASQSVYFIGTSRGGFVTLFQGVPYQLPAGIKLYKSQFVSGVSASTVPAARRRTLLDHSLRSQEDAADLLRRLELGQLGG